MRKTSVIISVPNLTGAGFIRTVSKSTGFLDEAFFVVSLRAAVAGCARAFFVALADIIAVTGVIRRAFIAAVDTVTDGSAICHLAGIHQCFTGITAGIDAVTLSAAGTLKIIAGVAGRNAVFRGQSAARRADFKRGIGGLGIQRILRAVFRRAGAGIAAKRITGVAGSYFIFGA